jgi:hypothetical protein
MSTCPQCGKAVQAGVVLCPYCKVNMHAIRRAELESLHPDRPVLHPEPGRERESRPPGERRPGPDGLSIGKLTGVLFTSSYRR